MQKEYWYAFTHEKKKLYHEFDMIKINQEKSSDLIKKRGEKRGKLKGKLESLEEMYKQNFISQKTYQELTNPIQNQLKRLTIRSKRN
ncbi:hypothetical protein MHK_004810 [Candidatus Magnetomorum sp. HK-1]|nr:hypothetical protein MHK_004810 [Candidatus Magnetomorum sp. HK-1]